FDGKCGTNLLSSYSVRPLDSVVCILPSKPDWWREDDKDKPSDTFNWTCKGSDNGGKSIDCSVARKKTNTSCSYFATADSCSNSYNQPDCVWGGKKCYQNCNISQCPTDKYCNNSPDNQLVRVCLDKAKEKEKCDSRDGNDGCVSGLECINNQCVIQGQCNTGLKDQSFTTELDLRKNNLCNKRAGKGTISINLTNNTFSWICDGTNKENNSKPCEAKQKVKGGCGSLPNDVITADHLLSKIDAGVKQLCNVGIPVTSKNPILDDKNIFHWACEGINNANTIECSQKKKLAEAGSGCNSSVDCESGKCISGICVTKNSDCVIDTNAGCDTRAGEVCTPVRIGDESASKCVLNGECGGANKKSFNSESEVIKAGLCNYGTPTTVTVPTDKTKPFSWTCKGTANYGSDDNCSAEQKEATNNDEQNSLWDDIVCLLSGGCASAETLPNGETYPVNDSNQTEEEVVTEEKPENVNQIVQTDEELNEENNNENNTDDAEANSGISFKFSFVGVKPNVYCLKNNGISLNMKVLNLTTNKSQELKNISFVFVKGGINYAGDQVFLVSGRSLNNTFNNVNKNNQIIISGSNGLKKVMCVNNQNSDKVSECNIDLHRANDYIYNFANYELVLGDVNNDGVINLTDYSIVKSNISDELRCGRKEDINWDGLVNNLDLEMIKKQILN
nr:dockerin type I repeat-containing protein [Candidatus Shapirobacteria bacterium]